MSRSPSSSLSALWLLSALLPACGSPDGAHQQSARELLVEEVRGQTPAAPAAARLAMQQVPVAGFGPHSEAPTLQAGQELHDLVVHRGDTLVVLAQQAGLSVEELAAWNDRSIRAPLRASEVLRIPVAAGDALGFELRRAQAEDARLQRYIAGRGSILGVMSREVRTGETAWGIAMDEGAHPLWVVAMFNPTLDLDRLAIGEPLVLPVLGDQLPFEEAVAGEADPTDATSPESLVPEPFDPGEEDDMAWMAVDR